MKAQSHRYRDIAGILTWSFSKHRREAVGVLFAGLAATATQALGLLALIPILRLAAAGASDIGSPAPWLPETLVGLGWPFLLVVSAAGLLSVSVMLRHLTLRLAYESAGRYALARAEDCALMLGGVLRRPGADNDDSVHSVHRIIPAAPNSCAVLFLNGLLAANDMVLIVLFYCAAVAIAPVLGAAAAVIAIPFVALYARNIRENTDLAIKAGSARDELRAEKRALHEMLADSAGPDDPDFREALRRRFSSGVLARSLRDGIELRRRIRAAGVAIDHIGPLSVAVFGLLVIYAGELGFDLIELFIGYLLLRHCLASLSRLAENIAVVNRVYPGLRDYLRLLDAVEPPRPQPATAPGATARDNDPQA